jgi:pimeloyl-ACP methyl ester carboxylesterase
MAVALADGTSIMEIEGVKVEISARGKGPPLLFLHPGIGIDPAAPVLDRLAERARVIAPSHPGFGHSDLPKGMTNVDDLAYFYLDLIAALDLRNATLLGVSFGGWIAAQIAIKTTERLQRLVLADAFGIKVSDRETRDIADIFAVTEPQLTELSYFDPGFAKRDLTQLPEAELVTIARNREAMARFGWSPYMHDPKLKGRLHRIRIPTLVLWGAGDRIVAPDYGRAYAAAIPGARFELIERAGHFPHLEQPDLFARKVQAFVETTP